MNEFFFYSFQKASCLCNTCVHLIINNALNGVQYPSPEACLGPARTPSLPPQLFVLQRRDRFPHEHSACMKGWSLLASSLC